MRLTWFIHFHKAGGSTVIEMARRNGEVLFSPNANANPLSPDNKDLRPWELSAAGLRTFVRQTQENDVSFVASEWGVPDVGVLRDAEVRVITVIRDPVARILSSFKFDYLRGFSQARTLAEYVDHGYASHTFSNLYVRMLTGVDWRSDASAEDMLGLALARLDQMHHVAVLERRDSLVRLSEAAGWSHHHVHEKNSQVGTLTRAARASRRAREGRLDLVGRTLAMRFPIEKGDLDALRERNSLDVELYSRLLRSSAQRDGDRGRPDPT